MNENRVVIYQSKSGAEVRVKLDEENVWLNRHQIAELFGRDVKTIGKHINNALTEELRDFSVVAKIATTAADGKTYQVEHYSLDMILSVGYRVKSSEGVKFRIWANEVLRRYIVDGAAINKQRLLEQKAEKLTELLGVVRRLSEKRELSDGEAGGLLAVVSRYAPAFLVLDEYDRGELGLSRIGLGRPRFLMTYGYVRSAIDELAVELEKTGQTMRFFGLERGQSLEGVIGAIYQSFDGRELYRSTAEKAANLFYMIIKDHPFADGNKRIASFLLLMFLKKNHYDRLENGEEKISSRMVVALALLVAESQPKEKESLVLLICNLLKDDLGR